MINAYRSQHHLVKKLARVFDKNKTREDAGLITDLKFKAFKKQA